MKVFVFLDNENLQEPDIEDIHSLLYTHVYDLDVGLMRGIISAAAAPPNSLSSENVLINAFNAFNFITMITEQDSSGLFCNLCLQKEK